MAIRRIGQIFVDMGFIDDDQLEMLLEEQQQQPGEKLGKIAEEMGLINDDQLAQALAEQMNLQVINLAEANLAPEVLDQVSETMAQLYHVIPVQFEDNTLTVYSSTHCADCRVAKRFLDDHGVDYETIEIDRDGVTELLGLA